MKQLEELCIALDELGDFIVKSWSDDRTLREAFGWNCPALTRHDLSRMAKSLASRIKAADFEGAGPVFLARISDYPRRLNSLHADTVAQMFSGNASSAVPAFTQTIDFIETALGPYLDWRPISDNRLIPSRLHRRLRSIQASIEEIVPEKAALEASIRQINEATDAADSLPADLDSLKRARTEVEKISTNAAATLGKIEESHKRSGEHLSDVEAIAEEASKLIQQCQEAYRITTTTGLAASFDARAKSLSTSMWAWVVGLLIALGIGSYIGSNRVQELTVVLQKDVHWGVVLTSIALSALSVGAPIWFAWLATKQIGQRFRLAEDYGFKASVAKAYEGYRREAARIDKAFEARLFGSALTRLEEAPLRLVEDETHGSPWHELVSSKAFQSALEKVPSLRQKFMDITVDRKPDKTTGADQDPA